MSSSPGESTTLRPVPVLRRSRRSRILAGVCGGLGNYFGVDPVVVRAAFILMVVAGFGLGILLYVLFWLIIPEEEPGEVVRRAAEDRNGPRFLLGAALVIVGGILLITNLIPWLFDKGVLTAIALVAVGAVLVVKAIRP